MESNKNVYQEHGYRDRHEYLQSISEEYDTPIDVVITVADMLGPEEDFDGLIQFLIYSEGTF